MKTAHDLVGLNVFSMEEARILGKTAECVVDLSAGVVIGLVVKTGRGQEMGVARGDIDTVGRDAAMLTSASLLKPVADVPGLEAHRTYGGKQAPSIITQTGVVLGALGAVYVDEAATKVLSYEVVGDLVQAVVDGPVTVPIGNGVVHGRDAVVLPEALLTEIRRPGGLRAELEKAIGAVRDTAADVGLLRKGSAGGKIGPKARTTAEVATDKADEAIKAVKSGLIEAQPKKKAAGKAPAKAAPKGKARPKKAAVSSP